MTKHKIIAFLFSVLMIITAGSAPVLAVTDERFFVGNDIWAYDDKCVTGFADAVAVQLAGDDNEQKILNFFMRKGLSLAQASGFIGNMFQESGLRPDIVEGGRTASENEMPTNGVGFGLVQWTFTARQQPLVEFVRQAGVPTTDLGGQLGFVWEELNGQWLGTLNKLRATDDPVEAAVIIHDEYEVSADSSAAVRQVRGGKAKEVFDKYKDAPALAGAEAETKMNQPDGFQGVINKDKSDKGCNEKSKFAGGNFNQTLKAYAWPEWRGLTVEATKDYAQAVDRAKSEGRYIGGTAHPGIDCGGFVSLLIQDSGYDPGYNGYKGNTTYQEKWLQENWQSLGTSASIDPASLQPGDVAINSSHTFIYVGEVDGFGAKIASASWDERAPMADTMQSPTQPGFNWYRKK